MFEFSKLIPFGVIRKQRFSLSNWHYPCVFIFKTNAGADNFETLVNFRKRIEKDTQLTVVAFADFDLSFIASLLPVQYQ